MARTEKAERAYRAMLKEQIPVHDEYLDMNDRDSRLAKAFGGSTSGPLTEGELRSRYRALDGSMGGGPTAVPRTPPGEAQPGQPVGFEKRVGGDPE